MLKQMINLFRPTSYKVVASIGFTLTYIVAAFAHMVFASFFLRPFNNAQPSSSILLVIVNWIVLAALLYITSSLFFSKSRLSDYSLKRKEVLISVTILGLVFSHLFFEMPRFLSSIFPSLASHGGAGSIVLIVTAELLLSYILFSLLMYFIERFKKN